MRVLSLILSFVTLLALPGGASAGLLSAPGPNPNWTDMQKFEWYLGYMATAANTCGAYDEAQTLNTLARMSPYGSLGLGAVRGDGLAGPVCGSINNEVKELVADAKQIREYIEATYNCRGEGCYGQSLADWQFHECGDSLKNHFAILGVDYDDIRAVTMMNPNKLGSDADYLARVQFHSCQGSLYIDLTNQCVMEQTQTRGDCTIEGIKGY